MLYNKSNRNLRDLKAAWWHSETLNISILLVTSRRRAGLPLAGELQYIYLSRIIRNVRVHQSSMAESFNWLFSVLVGRHSADVLLSSKTS